MDRPADDRPVVRGTIALADVRDLRCVISDVLAAKPLDEQLLQRRVWTYVSAERNAGTAAGRVIMALTKLVEAGRIEPTPLRQQLMRRVILWSVDAYFGHLGGDIVGRADAPADA